MGRNARGDWQQLDRVVAQPQLDQDLGKVHLNIFFEKRRTQLQWWQVPRSCIRCHLMGGYLFSFDAGKGGVSVQAEFGASRLS